MKLPLKIALAYLLLNTALIGGNVAIADETPETPSKPSIVLEVQVFKEGVIIDTSFTQAAIGEESKIESYSEFPYVSSATTTIRANQEPLRDVAIAYAKEGVLLSIRPTNLTNSEITLMIQAFASHISAWRVLHNAEDGINAPTIHSHTQNIGTEVALGKTLSIPLGEGYEVKLTPNVIEH